MAEDEGGTEISATSSRRPGAHGGRAVEEAGRSSVQDRAHGEGDGMRFMRGLVIVSLLEVIVATYGIAAYYVYHLIMGG